MKLIVEMKLQTCEDAKGIAIALENYLKAVHYKTSGDEMIRQQFIGKGETITVKEESK
jgi:hypothetical protein